MAMAIPLVMAAVGTSAGVTAAGAATGGVLASLGAAATAALPMTAAALGAASAIKQGQSQAQAANYNAQAATMAANNANAAANANEEAQRRKAAVQLGQQRAGLVEGGIDISQGSGADLVNQAATNAEMDALNIRYQGQSQAAAYNTQAMSDRYQAKQATGLGMYLGAGAGALSGYTSARYLGGAKANPLTAGY